jgi:hypothetical protein
MNDTEKTIICDTHSNMHPAYVCQHLMHGPRLNFYPRGDDNDPPPDDWSSDCNRVLIESGGESIDDPETYFEVKVGLNFPPGLSPPPGVTHQYSPRFVGLQGESSTLPPQVVYNKGGSS